MRSVALEQATDYLAPEIGSLLVIAVDATSRVYDLSNLDLGSLGSAIAAPGAVATSLYVTLHAEGADVYWALSNNGALTISETACIAAGGTPAFSNNRCWRCPNGSEQSRRIERVRHRYLYLKGSGAGYARIMASSFASQGGSVIP